MSEKQDLQVREICLEVLLPVFRGEEFSHVLIKGVLDKNDDWEGAKKAFFKKLTMGVIERKIELDYCIGRFCSHPVNKLKPVIRAILEMGAYQILYMDQVYDTKACNLSVELAKKKGFKNLAGFVNGVLRSLAREKEHIVYPDSAKEPVRYLSVRYSMPENIVGILLSQYGFEACESMFAAALKENALSIRVRKQGNCLADAEKTGINEKKTARETYEDVVRRLRDAGAEVTSYGFLPDAYAIRHAQGVNDLPGFEEGLFTVQDPASQLVGYLAPLAEIVENGQAAKDAESEAFPFIMDVCAAPGGKSIHVADRLRKLMRVPDLDSISATEELAKGTGVVYSFDVSEKKAAKIRENVERMHVSNVVVNVQDATVYNEEYKEKADLVIADVPCSGLGVIGKKPDLKYRLTDEDLNSVVKLQKEIISNVVRYVKPGGYLLYSTCTVNRAENIEAVDWMEQNLPLRLTAFENLPEELKGDLVRDGALQLLPGSHGCDGFFIALLRRP